MRIGFIGAGKVGFSLGKYFVEHKIPVSGYYSRNMQSAKEAACFTKTRNYSSLEEVVADSEVLFITVSDSAIAEVWNQLKTLPVADKIICHCSGVLSSLVFSDIASFGCYGYSIHPLLAVSSKLQSYQEFSNAIFTIEGEAEYLQVMKDLISSCGNKVIPIRAEDKNRYHAAAVLASNLVLGLVETATEELVNCGFSKKDAQDALFPLISGNVGHLKEQSLEEALTGPVERGDSATIERHLQVLEGENKQIYKLLSKKALEIAKRKHLDREYQEMEEKLYD